MKKLLLILLVCFAIVVVSCTQDAGSDSAAGSSSALVGKWVYTSGSGKDSSTTTYEFKSNGTCSYKYSYSYDNYERIETGKWSIKNGQLFLEYTDTGYISSYTLEQPAFLFIQDGTSANKKLIQMTSESSSMPSADDFDEYTVEGQKYTHVSTYSKYDEYESITTEIITIKGSVLSFQIIHERTYSDGTTYQSEERGSYQLAAGKNSDAFTYKMYNEKL
ncbi:MAG: hypothetical protein IJS84_06550, partial [Spirochaetales bacterium]|nr:hypothetical protein [Spirochaetales bacterium]